MTQESVEQTRDKEASAPGPDDPRKPDHPTDLTKPTWGYVLRRAVSEFSRDKCTDLAAALTYFAVLSLFPALLALVSLLGVFGQGEATASAINNLIAAHAPSELASLLGPTISNLTTHSGAGLALAAGLVGALWTASGYVGAFGRAMNRIYEVEEGRPSWKLRPQYLLLTLVLVLIVAAIVFALVLSGGIANAVGDAIGLGGTAVTVWNIAKWPVVVFLAVLVLALLYYFTPNVKQPKFRWISIGSVVALVVAALAVLAFSVYVSNFSSYNATYGTIGSVIVLLLGLWIVNNVLLLGAEIDAELERGRELQAGIEAEEVIKLPPRDTHTSEKKAAKQGKLIDEARGLRRDRTGDDDQEDAASGKR